MANHHTFIKYFSLVTLLVLLALMTVGCSKSSESTAATETKADKKEAPAADTSNGDIFLAEHNIRLGMTMPEDGRTLIGVIDFSTLPASGIRIGSFSDEEPQCICICRDSGNTCTPAGCPDTCPVDFCADGTFPPCNDGMVIPNLKALLGPPVDPDGPPIN